MNASLEVLVNVMFVNKLSFLMSVIKRLKFTTIDRMMLPGREVFVNVLMNGLY